MCSTIRRESLCANVRKQDRRLRIETDSIVRQILIDAENRKAKGVLGLIEYQART